MADVRSVSGRKDFVVGGMAWPWGSSPSPVWRKDSTPITKPPLRLLAGEERAVSLASLWAVDGLYSTGLVLPTAW